MIRVLKPVQPPAVLAEKGEAAAKALCEEFDRAPDDFRSGARRLLIDDAIYGHPTVVEALTAAQHRKCCFCERKMLGDVEHFRPKGAFQQAAGDPLIRPGYYWLAYEWHNLFIACGPCNQRFKRNLFPLLRPERRALSHHDEVALEEPLLLHPSEDPSPHIGFREEVAFPVNGSVRDQTTIDTLKLNRLELLESRRGILDKLTELVENRAVLAALLRAQGNRESEAATAYRERMA